MNPVVKVACGKDIKETGTRKGTNNPYFDEMLYFNFKERPDEMFDRVVEIKVLNAKKLIKDALIGAFKVSRYRYHGWFLHTQTLRKANFTEAVCLHVRSCFVYKWPAQDQRCFRVLHLRGHLILPCNYSSDKANCSQFVGYVMVPHPHSQSLLAS